MTTTVSFRDLVDELQMLSNGRHACLNRVTGEVVAITDEDVSLIEHAEDDNDQ